MNALIVPCLVALVGAAGPFDGTWNHQDTQVTLKQDGQAVSGQWMRGAMQGSITANVMAGSAMGNFENGGQYGVFMARPQGDGLAVTFNSESLTLTRGKRKQTKPAASPAPVAQAPAAPAPKVQAQRSAVEDAGNGWRADLPPGWAVVKSGTPATLGSQTEAGIVQMQYFQSDLNAARAALSRTTVNGNVTMKPSGKVSAFKVQGMEAVTVDGRLDAGGESKRTHCVMVVRGSDSVMVLGITDDAHFKVLKQRVDEIARAVVFTRAPLGPAVGFEGDFCLSGSTSDPRGGGSSSSLRYSFDGRGRITRRSSSSYYGTTNNPYAVGSDSSSKGSYGRRGNHISIHWDDGKKLECDITEFSGGMPIELTCNNDLKYGAWACG